MLSCKLLLVFVRPAKPLKLNLSFTLGMKIRDMVAVAGIIIHTLSEA